MHRKIISHIIDHGTSEHMHELKEVLCKTIDKLKKNIYNLITCYILAKYKPCLKKN